MVDIIIPRHHIFVTMGRVRVRDLPHRIAVWMAVQIIVVWDIHIMVIMGEDVMLGDIINNHHIIYQIILTFPRLHHNHNVPWYYPWHLPTRKLVNGARTLDR